MGDRFNSRVPMDGDIEIDELSALVDAAGEEEAEKGPFNPNLRAGLPPPLVVPSQTSEKDGHQSPPSPLPGASGGPPPIKAQKPRGTNALRPVGPATSTPSVPPSNPLPPKIPQAPAPKAPPPPVKVGPTASRGSGPTPAHSNLFPPGTQRLHEEVMTEMAQTFQNLKKTKPTAPALNEPSNPDTLLPKPSAFDPDAGQKIHAEYLKEAVQTLGYESGHYKLLESFFSMLRGRDIVSVPALEIYQIIQSLPSIYPHNMEDWVKKILDCRECEDTIGGAFRKRLSEEIGSGQMFGVHVEDAITIVRALRSRASEDALAVGVREAAQHSKRAADNFDAMIHSINSSLKTISERTSGLQSAADTEGKAYRRIAYQFLEAAGYDGQATARLVAGLGADTIIKCFADTVGQDKEALRVCIKAVIAERKPKGAAA